MKNTSVIFFGGFISVILLMTVFFYYRTRKAWEENLRYNFHGIVEKVSYDVKEIPEVTVSGEKYYLGSGYDFQHLIEVGDSLSKASRSNVYVLTKKTSGRKITFQN